MQLRGRSVLVAGVWTLACGWAAVARAEAPDAAPVAEPAGEVADEAAAAKSLAEMAEMDLFDLLDVDIEVASTKADKLSTAPSTVTVIDRAMLERFQFATVVEALNHVAGVSVVRTYLKRNVPTIRGILQDHYANKVLVLIDGVPAWNAVTGEGYLERISINDVERIEVLRGPASVLYGTNAYSGAINIVLRDPDATAGRLDLRVGSERHIQGGAHYGLREGDFRLFIAANASDEQGNNRIFVDERNVRGRVREYLRGSDFTLRSQYRGHSLLFNAFSAHESYLGVVPTFASGAGKDHWTRGYLANYTFDHQLGERVGVNAGATFDWSHRNLSRTADDTVRANIKGWRGQAFLKSRLTLDEALSFDVGANFDYRYSYRYANYEVLNQVVQAENNMHDRSVYEYSAFAQGNARLDPVQLVLGVRWTNNELFASNLAFRGSAVASLASHSTVKLVAGQSFRAPTLFELYFETPQATTFGNVDLDPETSNSVELAYIFSAAGFFVQALGYWAQYDNKIFRVRRLPNDPTDTSTIYVNGGRFSAIGAELEARYHNPRWVDAFVTYYYVHGDNGDEYQDDGHYNFKYVPEHTASLGLSKSLHGFFLSAVGHLVTERHGRLRPLGEQVVLDASLGYERGAMRHSLSAKNILDENVRVPEYVRDRLNAYPLAFGRRVFYRFELAF